MPSDTPDGTGDNSADGSRAGSGRRSPAGKHGSERSGTSSSSSSRSSASASTSNDSTSPSPRQSLGRRQRRSKPLKAIKRVVNEAQDWVADRILALEARPPTSAASAAVITEHVTASVTAQVAAIAAANHPVTGMSQSHVRSAVAIAVQVLLLRGSYKVGVVRLLKRLHLAKEEDAVTPVFPPSRRLANRWVRENFERVVYGTVLRYYKGQQLATPVPEIFTDKTSFVIDGQDDVDKAMVALLLNHLADGRSAARVAFYNEFGFFLLHEDVTVRIRLAFPNADEPLAAEAAGSAFFAYTTSRIVTPSGVPAAVNAAHVVEGSAQINGRVLAEEGCFIDQADAIIQCLTRSITPTEPIALKIFAMSLRRTIATNSPMWKELVARDIMTNTVGPFQRHLVMPRLSTRARLDLLLLTMTEAMTGALPAPDSAALATDSESEEDAVMKAAGAAAPQVEGPDDW